MSFTERQRRIISLLTERGSLTIVEYLLICATESREVELHNWQDVIGSTPGRFHMFIPQWNSRSSWLLIGIKPNAHQDVLEFFTLMRDLHARKLVTIITDPKRHVRASAVVGAVYLAATNESDNAALEIDALLQTPSELLGLSVSAERVYALPALHELRARQFVPAEDALSLRQRELLQTQQRTISRLVPLLVIAVICCVLLAVAGFLTYRSMHKSAVPSTDGKELQSETSGTLEPKLKPPPKPEPRVLVQRDTVIIRDTVLKKPEPSRKPRKLWYME
ncbi:MAG: hypothetical protein RL156_1837 [Bacteroidota bacterium]|jgi:hypothetical protein